MSLRVGVEQAPARASLPGSITSLPGSCCPTGQVKIQAYKGDLPPSLCPLYPTPCPKDISMVTICWYKQGFISLCPRHEAFIPQGCESSGEALGLTHRQGC